MKVKEGALNINDNRLYKVFTKGLPRLVLAPSPSIALTMIHEACGASYEEMTIAPQRVLMRK